MKKIINISLGILTALCFPLALFAQDLEVEGMKQEGMIKSMMQSENGQLLLLIGGMLILLIILLLVMLFLLVAAARVILSKNVETAEGKVEKVDFLRQLKQKWITGKLKPVSQEGDMLLDHNYDGIQEMDYSMPPWLRYIFIGTFIFAVFYVPAYLFFDWVPDQKTEYQAEIQAEALRQEMRAKAGLMSITAETAEQLDDEATITAGQAIFNNSCAVCHAQDGGGGVGPNLTDEFWIHENDIEGIFTTVSEGVPQKGMVPWKGKLSPKEIQDVANYVISLAGKKPAKPKEPQGEKSGFAGSTNEKAE